MAGGGAVMVAEARLFDAVTLADGVLLADEVLPTDDSGVVLPGEVILADDVVPPDDSNATGAPSFIAVRGLMGVFVGAAGARAQVDDGRLWRAGLVLARHMANADLRGRVLEVGCGGAFLGLAVNALGLPDVCVTATDQSPKALAVARRNLILQGAVADGWGASRFRIMLHAWEDDVRDDTATLFADAPRAACVAELAPAAASRAVGASALPGCPRPGALGLGACPRLGVEEKFDVVLCADGLYCQNSAVLLASTISKRLRPDAADRPKACAIVAVTLRAAPQRGDGASPRKGGHTIVDEFVAALQHHHLAVVHAIVPDDVDAADARDRVSRLAFARKGLRRERLAYDTKNALEVKILRVERR
ncbi:hypothetical protein M885DRAFT_534584 [Pelagophyceae sp. CCMP2097]|nr:hypothetical protein M885DRAFT_534584 [Pelagophyceae sp. CCMP2097]